jgi:hypothetical protein
MSERLHLDFVCGITNFPHDSRGRPIWSASRSDNVYPPYVPPEQPGPITEWQEAPLHGPGAGSTSG